MTKAAPSGAPDPDAPYRAFLADAVGGEVNVWTPLVGGNSRTTWLADVQTATATVPAVVRAELGGGPFSGTALTLAREAVVYQALQSTDVRLPRVLGYDAPLAALALERLPGSETWNGEVLDGLLGELATLHSIDPATLELPGFSSTAWDDVQLWAAIATDGAAPASPFVDCALEVLAREYPGEPERIVLTHGDAGPGNLLFHDGHVTGLLDWEFSHLGDPVDDLAWITVRTAMFGVELPNFGRRVREHYAARIGVVPDERRLRFWQAVIVLRNLITCLASVGNPVRGRDRLVHYMLIPSLNRLLITTLARLANVHLDPPAPRPEAGDLPGAEVVREIAVGLGDLIPAVADKDQEQRARRMRYLLTQFAETWSLAPGIAAENATDGQPAELLPERLRQLARIADRQLALFPRAASLAYAQLPGLDDTDT